MSRIFKIITISKITISDELTPLAYPNSFGVSLPHVVVNPGNLENPAHVWYTLFPRLTIPVEVTHARTRFR